MKHHQEKDPGVFIIWFVAALAVSLFFLVTSEAEGSQTMHLVDSYTERARGSQCPYTFISYD